MKYAHPILLISIIALLSACGKKDDSALGGPGLNGSGSESKFLGSCTFPEASSKICANYYGGLSVDLSKKCQSGNGAGVYSSSKCAKTSDYLGTCKQLNRVVDGNIIPAIETVYYKDHDIDSRDMAREVCAFSGGVFE